MERKPGYYMVIRNSELFVAEFTSDGWKNNRWSGFLSDSEFESIDPNPYSMSNNKDAVKHLDFSKDFPRPERKEGYYWVKIITDDWKVAYWDDNCQWWEINGKEYSGDEINTFFDAINESRIPSPDEPVVTAEMYRRLQEELTKWFKSPIHSYQEVIEFQNNVLGIEPLGTPMIQSDGSNIKLFQRYHAVTEHPNEIEGVTMTFPDGTTKEFKDPFLKKGNKKEWGNCGVSHQNDVSIDVKNETGEPIKIPAGSLVTITADKINFTPTPILSAEHAKEMYGDNFSASRMTASGYMTFGSCDKPLRQTNNDILKLNEPFDDQDK